MVTIAMKLKDGCSLEEKLWQIWTAYWKRETSFVLQSPSSQSYDFSSHPVWMWESYHKEGWALKNWCFQIVVLEKTLESPLDCKVIKPSILKKINPEYSLGGFMLKLQYFGHLMRRADSLENTLMLGRLRSGGEVGISGWDGWMASTIQSIQV